MLLDGEERKQGGRSSGRRRSACINRGLKHCHRAAGGAFPMSARGTRHKTPHPIPPPPRPWRSWNAPAALLSQVLTLEGNPVGQLPSYRARVIAALPGLRSLDGKPVDASERTRAAATVASEAACLAAMLSNACLAHKLVGGQGWPLRHSVELLVSGAFAVIASSSRRAQRRQLRSRRRQQRRNHD